MSSACTSGRQAMPLLRSRTSPASSALPTRSLTTRSPRSRGENPYAVALRRNTGEKSSSASVTRSCSERIFDSPYGVSGAKAAFSSSGESSVPAPYRLHDDENRNRGTPAALAARASRTVARWLTS